MKLPTDNFEASDWVFPVVVQAVDEAGPAAVVRPPEDVLAAQAGAATREADEAASAASEAMIDAAIAAEVAEAAAAADAAMAALVAEEEREAAGKAAKKAKAKKKKQIAKMQVRVFLIQDVLTCL